MTIQLDDNGKENQVLEVTKPKVTKPKVTKPKVTKPKITKPKKTKAKNKEQFKKCHNTTMCFCFSFFLFYRYDCHSESDFESEDCSSDESDDETIMEEENTPQKGNDIFFLDIEGLKKEIDVLEKERQCRIDARRKIELPSLYFYFALMFREEEGSIVYFETTIIYEGV